MADSTKTFKLEGKFEATELKQDGHVVATQEKLSEVESIAKGATAAKVFDTEAQMFSELGVVKLGITLPAGTTIVASNGGTVVEGDTAYPYAVGDIIINNVTVVNNSSTGTLYDNGYVSNNRYVLLYTLEEDTTVTSITANVGTGDVVDDEDGNSAVATGRFQSRTILRYTTENINTNSIPYDLITPIEEITVGTNLYIRETNVPDYWWDGEKPCELETKQVTLTNVPGEKIPGGGEIFNDYTNNKALSKQSHAQGNKTTSGSKAFSIVDFHSYGNNEGRFLLSSVTGLQSDMTYTAVLTNNFDFVGTITQVEEFNEDYSSPCISVTGVPSGSGITIKDTSYLLIPSRPDLGDIVVGEYAHSEGTETKAQAKASHAEGNKTTAAGKYAHAEGHSTIAAYAAHAEGHTTEATGEASHSEGKKSKATALAAHSEGNGTSANADSAHSEGRNTKAESISSHAEGENTEATGFASHAEGENTIASGNQSHIEGYASAKGSSNAQGVASHVEGYDNKAFGPESHAEGYNNTVGGTAAHVGGVNSEVGGDAAFGHGTNILTEYPNQVAFGSFNANEWNSLFAIGNGESEGDRQNAFSVGRDGTATIQTGPSESNHVAHKKYVDDAVGKYFTATGIKYAGKTLTKEKFELLIRFLETLTIEE